MMKIGINATPRRLQATTTALQPVDAEKDPKFAGQNVAGRPHVTVIWGYENLLLTTRPTKDTSMSARRNGGSS
jgi:hypothetical protein